LCCTSTSLFHKTVQIVEIPIPRVIGLSGYHMSLSGNTPGNAIRDSLEIESPRIIHYNDLEQRQPLFTWVRT